MLSNSASRNLIRQLPRRFHKRRLDPSWKQAIILRRNLHIEETIASQVEPSPRNDAIGTKLKHSPVMVKEVVEGLDPKDGQVFIDMTFGAGGHTKALLSTGKKIKIIGLDRDPVAFSFGLKLSDQVKSRPEYKGQEFVPLRGKFSDLPRLLDEMKIEKSSVNGILMDLGASSMQFDDPGRGFALSQDGPLDMRMGHDDEDQPTAADVVNTLDAEDLADIFKTYGEEKLSKKIAQAIIDARFMMKQIYTTKELAQIVANCTGGYASLDGIGRTSHSATKIFQALRIFVNNELNELNYAIEKVREYLVLERDFFELKEPPPFDPSSRHQEKEGADDQSQEINKDQDRYKGPECNPNHVFKDNGRIAVISFHSLEDRIVKQHIIDVSLEQGVASRVPHKFHNVLEMPSADYLKSISIRKWHMKTKHVQTPTETEVILNPRARSAKLRVAFRTL